MEMEIITEKAKPENIVRKPRKMRENTKQSQVIAMLRSPEGVTLRQIMDATGWQEHTTRAMLSRTIQKDLGIALTSIKKGNGERMYRSE